MRSDRILVIRPDAPIGYRVTPVDDLLGCGFAQIAETCADAREPLRDRRIARTNGSARLDLTMSRPCKCFLTTSSVTGSNAWFRQSVHLIRGFSQIPRTHSLRHAGAYPVLPVFEFSHLRGKTSSRPRKSERNRVILSALDNAVLVAASVIN
jgi:hypothetical protein